MDAMIGWGAFIAYMIVCVAVARNRIRFWYNNPAGLFHGETDGGERAILAICALGFGLIWPISFAFLMFRDWLWKPVDRDEERIARLKADLDDWRIKQHQGTEDERRMARDIVETLEELWKSAVRKGA